MVAHGVVLGARHLPAFFQARQQGLADLAAMVRVLPGERARALVAHDYLVAVEEQVGPGRQVEAAPLRAGLREALRRLLEVRLRRGVGLLPARRAARAD